MVLRSRDNSICVLLALFFRVFPSACESVGEFDPLARCAAQLKNDGVCVSRDHLSPLDSEAAGDKVIGTRKVEPPNDIPFEPGEKYGFNSVQAGMGFEIVHEGMRTGDTIDSHTVYDDVSQRSVMGRLDEQRACK
jgi:hypothetical protein